MSEQSQEFFDAHPQHRSEPLTWTPEMEEEYLEWLHMPSDVDRFAEYRSILARKLAGLPRSESDSAWSMRIGYLAARQRDADRIAELEAENKELREANAEWAEVSRQGIRVYNLSPNGVISRVDPDPPSAPTGTPTEGT